MTTTQTTNDPIQIEKRVKARDAVPCIVKGTEDLLRVRFDSLQDNLEEITRARFFQVIQEKNLQFLCDTSEKSRFYKIIS